MVYRKKKREISLKYDNRETKEIQQLSLNIVFAHYENIFQKKPKNFLEVGCNTGEGLKEVHNSIGDKNIQLFGMDPSKNALNSAEKNLNNAASLHLGKVEDKNIPNVFPPIDVIFVHLCFGLWDDPIIGLKNLIDCMSTNSVIYIVDLHYESQLRNINFATNKEEKKYLTDQYNASFSEEELHYILETCAIEHKNISFNLGTGTFGGFSYADSNFIKLINNPKVQEIIRSYNQGNNIDSSYDLQHGWVIKRE